MQEGVASVSWSRYYFVSAFEVDGGGKDPLLQLYSALLEAGIPALWKLAEYSILEPSGLPLGRPTRLFSDTGTAGKSASSKRAAPAKRRTSSRLNQKRINAELATADPTLGDIQPDEKRLHCRELWVFELNDRSLKKGDFPNFSRMQGIFPSVFTISVELESGSFDCDAVAMDPEQSDSSVHAANRCRLEYRLFCQSVINLMGRYMLFRVDIISLSASLLGKDMFGLETIFYYLDENLGTIASTSHFPLYH